MIDQILIGVLGNLATEPVRNALRSLSRARQHDLEPAVVAAFAAATGELARQAHTEDEQRIWGQLRDDALRPAVARAALEPILDALLLGDEEVLRNALGPVIVPYASHESPEVQHRIRQRLPRALLDALAGLLRGETYAGSWIEFQRLILQEIRRELQATLTIQGTNLAEQREFRQELQSADAAAAEDQRVRHQELRDALKQLEVLIADKGALLDLAAAFRDIVEESRQASERVRDHVSTEHRETRSVLLAHEFAQHEETRRVLRESAAELNTARSLSAAQVPVRDDVTLAAQRSVIEEILSRQLALAKEQIDAAQYGPALAILEQLKEGGEEFGWTDDMRYARRARLGSCYLAMGRSEEARMWFTEALALRPNDLGARINLLVARHVCDEPAGELLEDLVAVLHRNPAEPVAIRLKASLLLTLGRARDAIEWLEANALLLGAEDLQHDYLLATAYLQAGLREPAEDMARAAVQRFPGQPEAHELLGEYLLHTGIRARDGGVLDLIPVSQIQVRPDCLHGAAEEFARAVERYEREGRTVMAARCSLHRAVALLELDQLVAARDAYLAATANKPPRDILLPGFRGLARVALTERDPATASKYLKLALEHEPDDVATAYNLGIAELQLGLHDKAEERLSELLKRPDLPGEMRLAVQVLRASIVRISGDRDRAAQLLSSILYEAPAAWEAYLEQAQLYLDAHAPDSALASLGQALELAPDELPLLEAAVTLLYRLRAAAHLAELYPRLLRTRREMGRRLDASAYHNAGTALLQADRPEEALHLLDEAEAEGINRVELLEIRAHVMMALHTYLEAERCWLALLDRDRDDVRVLRGLAETKRRLFDYPEALRLLRRVAALDKPDAALYLAIADLSLETNALPEAARWARRAVDAGADPDPDLLMGAISVAIHAGRVDLAMPWITLFHERWPDSPLLVVGHYATPEEGAVQIYEHLRPLQEWGEQWLGYYRSHPLPLACLAEQSGSTLPDLWERITTDLASALEIRCHSGNREDNLNQQMLAHDSHRITVDVVALLSLELLGHLNLLSAMYDEVLVPEPLLTHLQTSLHQVQEPASRRRLERIIDVLVREPKVRRISLPIVSPPEEVEQWHKLLGNLGWLPLLTADVHSVPLYSDELGLQSIARQRGRTAFSTIGMLGAAVIKGHIDEEEYDRALQTLIARRYVRIPFTGKLLASAIRASLTGEKTAADWMLAAVKDPVADRRAYAIVFGDALHRIWSDWPAGFAEKQHGWTNRLLEHAHFEDGDAFCLQAAVVTWGLCALQTDCGSGVAAGIRHVYDWFRIHRLDLEFLEAALASAARKCGRNRDGAIALVNDLTAGCPKSFRLRVCRKAAPKPGGQNSGQRAQMRDSTPP
jgi:tetratricopeptide (TPR) repeat protein